MTDTAKPGTPITLPEALELLRNKGGPERVSDRKLRRLKFKNAAAIRGWNPSVSDIVNSYILNDNDRSLTFVNLEFSRIRLTQDRNIACVVLNKFTRRFEMHLNLKRVVGYHLQTMLKRADAPRFPTDDPRLEPIDVQFETVADFDKSVAKTLDQIVLHEFGHLWFKHLKYEIQKAPPETLPYLNIATDSLVNFHLNVKLGVYKLHDWPIENGILALTPILFPMLKVDYAAFNGLAKKDILRMGVDPRLTPKTYESWRVIASQLVTFKPMGLASLRDAVEEIREHSKKYTASITEIAQKIAALFPDRPPCLRPCVSRGGNNGNAGGPGDNANGEAATGDDEFIDVHDIPPDELPPRFDETVRHILAGRGGPIMERILQESENIRASKRMISVIQAATEKDPGKFIIRTMGKVVENKVHATYRPTKRPVIKSLALTNAFARSDPARFRTTHTLQDRIASNKLDIYVDVSGSFAGLLVRLYSFLQDLSRIFSVRAWQFSTEIMPLSKTDIAEGRVKTTDGTDGDVILAHMRQRFELGVRKYAVLGDRYYGSFNEKNIEFPSDIWVIDIGVGYCLAEPWFKASKNLHVTDTRLDAKFQIVGEEEDHAPSENRRRRSR